MLLLIVMASTGCAWRSQHGGMQAKQASFATSGEHEFPYRSARGRAASSGAGLHHLGGLQRVTDLFGMELKNYRDERLGMVTDLAVDLKGARVILVFAASGSFLGMGGKRTAVPPDALIQHTDGKTLVLNADRMQLAAAPSVDWPGWIGKIGPVEIDAIYRHYDLSRHSSGEKLATVGSGDLRVASEEQVAAKTSEPIDQPDIIAARSIVGRRVANAADEHLGYVRDIVVDLINGRVACVILGVDTPGMTRDKLVAIPSGVLLSEASSKSFQFNAEKRRLQRAAIFSDEAWPDFSKPAWGVEAGVHPIPPTRISSDPGGAVEVEKQPPSPNRLGLHGEANQIP